LDVARIVNYGAIMVQLNSHQNLYRNDFLSAVLEDAQMGIAVVEGTGHVHYLNAAARRLLDVELGQALPESIRGHLLPLLERLWAGGARAVDRWVIGEMVIRVHARPIDRARNLVALEIVVEQQPGHGTVAERLAKSLALSVPDARLLAFVWRGMSNEDIARTLNVRLGTVKSRLFRLYQRIGVTKRATAVLRAAEVLQEQPGPVAEA
jgi:DNA-binding CsgD family transcriptional regulator